MGLGSCAGAVRACAGDAEAGSCGELGSGFWRGADAGDEPGDGGGGGAGFEGFGGLLFDQWGVFFHGSSTPCCEGVVPFLVFNLCWLNVSKANFFPIQC